MAMEEITVRDAEAPPIACTLTPADQSTRRAAWRALRGEALIGESRDGLVWTTLWRRNDDVRARLEALVEAEKACCPFLAFEVDELRDAIRVRTLFPANSEAMLEAMQNAVA